MVTNSGDRAAVTTRALCIQLIICLGVITAVASDEPSGDNDQASERVLPLNEMAPKWYRRYSCFTRWPRDLTSLSAKEDVKRKYFVSALPEELFKAKVLEPDWEQRILRKKDWIPADIASKGSLDAYIYRQKVDSGSIILCDTRPLLVVVFVPDDPHPMQNDPRARLDQVTERLFKITISKAVTLTRDETTDIFLGTEGFGPALELMVRSATAATRSTSAQVQPIAPPNPHGHSEASYFLHLAVGKTFIVYEVQKIEVPGCNLDERLPFFSGSAIGPATQSSRGSPGDEPPVTLDQLRRISNDPRLAKRPAHDGDVQKDYLIRGERGDAEVAAAGAFVSYFNSLGRDSGSITMAVEGLDLFDHLECDDIVSVPPTASSHCSARL